MACLLGVYCPVRVPANDGLVASSIFVRKERSLGRNASSWLRNHDDADAGP
jgi:hypothetical protein